MQSVTMSKVQTQIPQKTLKPSKYDVTHTFQKVVPLVLLSSFTIFAYTKYLQHFAAPIPTHIQVYSSPDLALYKDTLNVEQDTVKTRQLSLLPSAVWKCNALIPVMYVAYSLIFPFISYFLFDATHRYTTRRDDRVTRTALCFGLLVSVLYVWFFFLGSRVSTFVYPVLCVAGVVPILKLLALEFHCLDPKMHQHIRNSFWNYYFYLITPSEVVFEPKEDISKISKERFISGLGHFAAFLVFNNVSILLHFDSLPNPFRCFFMACQLSLCFCMVADLSTAPFGFLTHRVFLKDMFKFPYLAENPKEFWSKRWNIVVHQYIVKLLYFPLGGEKRKTILMPLIFMTVGLLHEFPMLFLPSAKFGFWMKLFGTHMCAIFIQELIEKMWPKSKTHPKAKLALRIATLVLLSYTCEFAYKGFGLSIETWAKEFNHVLAAPLHAISSFSIS